MQFSLAWIFFRELDTSLSFPHMDNVLLYTCPKIRFFTNMVIHKVDDEVLR